MKVKKLISVDQFYDQVIVKDKKLTWKCPICNEECRFLNQHLQRKHNIDFFQYFKDNVDYSCQYCGKYKELDDLKWDKLKVSKPSLDHKDCIDEYKKSQIKERYCLNCNKPIAKHSTKFCSYSCSNMYRHKDLDFCIKHATSIKNSYTEELREARRQQNKPRPTKTGIQPRKKNHNNKHFCLDWYMSEQVNNVLAEMKKEGKSYLNKFQSKPERDFILYLLENEIDFVYQHIIDNKRFDFYFPQYNLILELDGCYFHSLNQNDDKLKSRLAIESGYNFCRFSSNCKDYNYYFLDFNWETTYENYI